MKAPCDKAVAPTTCKRRVENGGTASRWCAKGSDICLQRATKRRKTKARTGREVVWIHQDIRTSIYLVSDVEIWWHILAFQKVVPL
jgi:hypothetical protein